MQKPVITHNVLRILRLFVLNKPKKLSGYGIAKTMNVDCSTVWAALNKLEDAGWLVSERERVHSEQVGRAPRKLYSLTQTGEKQATSELKALQI